MNESEKDDQRQLRAAGAALFAGLLLYLAILLLQVGSPSFLVWQFSLGAYAPDIDDEAVQYPIALVFLGLFCWRSLSLYRQRIMSVSSQLCYVATGVFLSFLAYRILDSQVTLDIGW